MGILSLETLLYAKNGIHIAGVFFNELSYKGEMGTGNKRFAQSIFLYKIE